MSKQSEQMHNRVSAAKKAVLEVKSLAGETKAEDDCSNRKKMAVMRQADALAVFIDGLGMTIAELELSQAKETL